MTWLDDLPADRQAILAALLDHPRVRHLKTMAAGDVGYGCWLIKVEAATLGGSRRMLAAFAGSDWKQWYRDGLAPEAAATVACYYDDYARGEGRHAGSTHLAEAAAVIREYAELIGRSPGAENSKRQASLRALADRLEGKP